MGLGFGFAFSRNRSTLWANYGPYEVSETARIQERIQKMLQRTAADVFQGADPCMVCLFVSVRADGDSRIFDHGSDAMEYIASLAE